MTPLEEIWCTVAEEWIAAEGYGHLVGLSAGKILACFSVIVFITASQFCFFWAALLIF